LKRSESGQTSLEYIFLLMTAVMACMLAFNVFLKPAFSKLTGYIGGRFDRSITQGDLHRMPFR
jgi:hypothetical protein